MQRGWECLAHVVSPAGARRDAIIRLRQGASNSCQGVEIELPSGAADAVRLECYLRAPASGSEAYDLAAVFALGKAPAPGPAAVKPAPMRSKPSLKPGQTEFYASYQRSGARLEEPRDGRVTAGVWQRFRITAPQARVVRIGQGETYYYFHRVGRDSFAGHFKLAAGDWTIFASFSEGATQMEGLVGLGVR
jgi:hypothetical protein